MYLRKIPILLLLLSATNPILAASPWQKARITDILPEGSILFGKQQTAFLSGIKYSAFEGEDSCFRRVILKQLREKWIGLDIQWRADQHSILAKHTEFGNLSEYLLKNGMARLDETKLSSYYKGKFRASTTQAQEKQKGIWRGCSKEHAEQKIRLIREKQYFMNKYEGFLAPVSTAKVKRIIEGNLIELTNGAKVKLIGVQIPEEDEKNSLESCFRDQARNFLTSLIQGRTIILRSDRVDFDQKGTLLRYVYLPSWRKNGDEQLINQALIEKGFAKSHWPDKNIKYKELFMSLQSTSYQSQKGSWSTCFAKEIQNNRDSEKSEKELIYNEDCRIKGNISGTKTSPIKKYHTPLSPWYTRITKPERCFSTVEEAEKDGFQKVR